MSNAQAIQPVYLITGVMASGKSTVAQALAEALPRSVHVKGDVFRRMIVSGRAEMAAVPSAEALAQLRLRYRLTAQTALTYQQAGFTPVVQDVILGPMLAEVVELYRSVPLRLTVLCPDAATVLRRESSRPKVGYRGFSVDDLQHVLLTETPRLGLWLDSSKLTLAETVEAITRHSWEEPAGR